MRILVTGAAGFIGFHTSLRLLELGHEVIGIDNINDYYDPQLKLARLQELETQEGFRFSRMDIADRANVEDLFAEHQFDRVVHLAAQAGVRYSLTNPHAYVEANIVGFLNILEGCRNHQSPHLIYASSSSVYGGNKSVPFRESDRVDSPVSLYAATKKSNELMAHVYSHLYDVPTTGLRFFTVYGPWGRPDMAMWLFTEAILNNRPINVFNDGELKRDFTYIDDIVEGVVRLVEASPVDVHGGGKIAQVFNIGNNEPVRLMDFICTLESALGKRAEKRLLPMQPGDVLETYADTSHLEQIVGFRPSTPLATGIAKFCEWYCNRYKPELVC